MYINLILIEEHIFIQVLRNMINYHYLILMYQLLEMRVLIFLKKSKE
jgi:hypothetical protein